jgi:trimeric autotransporter adhesin
MKASIAALAAVAALLLVATAAGAGATLPGGTSLDVTISSPGNGSTLPDAPVTVTGTAAIGKGTPVADTTLIYVVDVSGSTNETTGDTGACPKQNVYDSLADTTLDCELLAIRDLNQAAIASGTIAQIGMIAFAGDGTDTTTHITSAAALDLSSSTGAQALVAPDANDFTPIAGMTTVFTPATNLDWVVQSTFLYDTGVVPPLTGWPSKPITDGFTLFTPHVLGESTNYTAALYELESVLADVTTTNTVVVFLSDGLPTQTVQSQPLATVLGTLPTSGLTIDTFAVGSSASCGTAPPANYEGSLEQIAQHFGKHCQVLADASDAVSAVPEVVSSQLSSIDVSADGGTPAAADTVTPALPQAGPQTVDWSSTLNLGVGSHTICATAGGSDGGGSGTAQDCVSVTVQATPTVTLPGDGTSGYVGEVDEGSSFDLTATADGATSTTWSASGGTGHCTFADPEALDTSVTCDDNGTYTLTLTANDGVNPPVTATEHLLVDNVPPSLSLTATIGGLTVTANGAVSDPGTNDVLSCSFVWGDGATTTSAPTGGVCTSMHTYGVSEPSYTVTVTASDDDGGATTKSVTVSPTASELKQLVLSSLQTLVSTATRTQDVDRLNEAIAKLTDALTPSNWLDGDHLQPLRGNHVFDDEKDAADRLQELLNDPQTQVSTTDVAGWIGDLVQVDELLAATAISDGTNAGGDAKKLAGAQDLVTQALLAGPHDAIDDYKNAWHRAEQSVHKL